MTDDVNISFNITYLHSQINDQANKTVLSQDMNLSYKLIVVGINIYYLVTK